MISEKPLAIRTSDCDTMIREAKKRKVMLTTYHNRHWDGCVLEALKHIRREKAIGDVYRVEAHIGGYGQPGDWWRSSKSISGGILYDWGVHLLEYALQIIDDEIVEVTGYGPAGLLGSEDPLEEGHDRGRGFGCRAFQGRDLADVDGVVGRGESEGGAVGDFRHEGQLRVRWADLRDDPAEGRY